jgi:hypothetical protein
MSTSVFYSWQSDLPNNRNRGLIRKALDKAIRAINYDLDVEEAIRVDQDTQGVPGSPAITDTILRKIEQFSVFVPDVSFVCGTDDSRKCPNPNVMIEYGYALKVCGDERIISVFNTAFGDWEKLPFDMKHKRRPILYCASDDLSVDERRGVRDKLAKELETALRTTQESGLFESLGEPAPVHEPVVAMDEYGGSFLDPHEALGQTRSNLRLGETKNLRLRNGALLYVRLWPKSPRTKNYTNTEVYNNVNTAQLRPMCSSQSGGWSYGRNRHGAFSFYTFNEPDNEAIGITQLFKTGEIWGIDTYYLNIPPRKETAGHAKFIPTTEIESDLLYTLTNYLEAARDHIGLTPPLELRVGMTRVGGYELAVETKWFMHPFVGKIFEPAFKFASSIESYDSKVDAILLPFFSLMYDMAGEVRPEPNI